ncbi:MAG TPA: radical SAM protein [Thermoanaerobaculia bacterium]|nr:radical SAM protein [Thermoanaerobaculia bacterium]
MIRITEIFYSIQGESTHAGRPCIFIRLTGCNLRCSWCDSAYTFTGGEPMSIDAILEAIAKWDCRLVEVTGGEPLAQKESFELIRRLADAGYEVLIETSGSIDIEPVDPRAKVILDVKCPGSGEEAKNFWPNLSNLRPHDEVKFVIADRADYEYAREVVQKHRLEGRPILFSPVWGAIDLKDLAAWMLEDGIEARFQVQLHKLIWGADARGV